MAKRNRMTFQEINDRIDAADYRILKELKAEGYIPQHGWTATDCATIVARYTLIELKLVHKGITDKQCGFHKVYRDAVNDEMNNRIANKILLGK